MAIHSSKYWSAMMTSECRQSLILIMAFLVLSPVGLLRAQTVKQDFLFSGSPKMEPNVAAGAKITIIDGDLTVQNFDDFTLDETSAFGPFARLEKVTGTVTIQNLSALSFAKMKALKEIGGNCEFIKRYESGTVLMHENPDLEEVNFLKNNVSVKGSIEGKNCPKLCQKHSYLISVDKKYSNLFDEDCFTLTGDVDMLSKNNTIGTKTVIKGSLTCNSATNPQFENFNGLEVLASLKKLFSVESLVLDNCPIASLSTTLSSLKKVESTVKIVNCAKLEDKKFSDWLYNIETIHSNMVLENNKNVCLERKHAEDWKSKKAKIADYTACGEMTGDADLSKPSTLTNGTTVVKGKILCVDVKGTEFSSEAKKFLANIKSVKALEFTRCEPFVNFKQIFPNGLPKADSVEITGCPNFETDLDVLEIVQGKTINISIVDNPKICFSEVQLHTNFNGSKIKQTKFCGQPCSGGIVAYRKGAMKSNINLTEECDKIEGELIFEGELPSKEEASLFANIRSIEGSLIFHGIKNKPITNRIFELLPNLQKIDFKPEETPASYSKYGCAVIILGVKEIDHFDMKRLETIKCGTTNCICIEGSPEYEKAIMNSDDWAAVKANQTSVAFYPQNVVLRCWTTVDYEKHIIKLVLAGVLVFTINPIIIFFFFVFYDEKGIKSSELNKELAKMKEKEEKEKGKGKGKGKGGSKEKAKETAKEKEKSVVQSVTEPSMEEDSRLKSVQTDVEDKTKTEKTDVTETPKTAKTPHSKKSKKSVKSKKSKKSMESKKSKISKKSIKSKKSQSKKRTSKEGKGKDTKPKKKKMEATQNIEATKSEAED